MHVFLKEKAYFSFFLPVNDFLKVVDYWLLAITATQLDSTELEFRFCTSSILLTRSQKTWDGENIEQCSLLDIVVTLFVDQPCRKSNSSSFVTFLLIHFLRTGSQTFTIIILPL